MRKTLAIALGRFSNDALAGDPATVDSWKFHDMPTISRCPHCLTKLQIPSKKVGNEIRCPECGCAFIFPAQTESISDSPNAKNSLAPLQVGALPYWLAAFGAMMTFDCGMGLLLQLNQPRLPDSMYAQIGLSAPSINVGELLRNTFGLAAGVTAFATSLAIWKHWSWWIIGIIVVIAFSAVGMFLHAADLYVFHAAAELAIIIYGSIKLASLRKLN